jgi:hypothetical protein
VKFIDLVKFSEVWWSLKCGGVVKFVVEDTLRTSSSLILGGSINSSYPYLICLHRRSLQRKFGADRSLAQLDFRGDRGRSEECRGGGSKRRRRIVFASGKLTCFVRRIVP